MDRLCFATFCNLASEFYLGKYRPTISELVASLLSTCIMDPLKADTLVQDSSGSVESTQYSYYYKGKRDINPSYLDLFKDRELWPDIKSNFGPYFYQYLNPFNIEKFCIKLRDCIALDGEISASMRKRLIGLYESIKYDYDGLNPSIIDFLFEVFIYSVLQPPLFKQKIDNAREINEYNLPYSYLPSFVGREDELAFIKDNFTAERRIQTVSGIRGIGKTTIVSEYLRKNRYMYQSIYWIDCSTTETIKGSLENIFNIIDININQGIRDFTRTIKASDGWIVILQNLNYYDESGRKFFDSCFSQIKILGHVIITTECSSPIHDEPLLPLRGLKMIDAIALFKELTNFSDYDDEGIELFCRSIDNNPTFISQCAYFATAQKITSLDDFLRILSEEGLHCINSGSLTEKYNNTYVQIIQKSIDYMSADARDFIFVMSFICFKTLDCIFFDRLLFDGDFSSKDIIYGINGKKRDLSKEDIPEIFLKIRDISKFRDVVYELSKYSICRINGPGNYLFKEYYSFYDGVRFINTDYYLIDIINKSIKDRAAIAKQAINAVHAILPDKTRPLLSALELSKMRGYCQRIALTIYDDIIADKKCDNYSMADINKYINICVMFCEYEIDRSPEHLKVWNYVLNVVDQFYGSTSVVMFIKLFECFWAMSTIVFATEEFGKSVTAKLFLCVENNKAIQRIVGSMEDFSVNLAIMLDYDNTYNPQNKASIRHYIDNLYSCFPNDTADLIPMWQALTIEERLMSFADDESKQADNYSKANLMTDSSYEILF